MDLEQVAGRLRKLALAYPESYEESPWGDRVVKVKGKIFLFCGVHDGSLGLSVKLPSSGREVLRESWAKPTAYGLGKSGWVSITLGKSERVAEARLAGWIDESYRAMAPKKLLAQLGGAASAPEKKVVRRLAHRVLLLCEDRLRIDRAVRALLAEGVTVEPADSAGAVRARLKKLDAVIIDAGRSQDDGLKLAGEIDASDHPIHLFIAGLRDARAQAGRSGGHLRRAVPFAARRPHRRRRRRRDPGATQAG